MASSVTSIADPVSDSQEERLFALLDAYVESLRGRAVNGGELDPPAELLAAFPELGQMLDCLDALESVCPRAVNPSEAPTMYPASGVEGATICAPVLPRNFGSYELLAEIGRGGMGVVYRARHRSLGATVAVKMIRASQLASDDEIRRFYQEAREAARLTHSHIVKVHDVGECEGQHFLAMDLVEGTTLASLLSETEPLEPERAAGMLADLARAVHYLHTQGIIHRDLKPSNVLVDGDGEPHLTDFGLVKVLTRDSRETTTGTIIGTPCYMSPEQARGQSTQVTSRSDVYSLGAMLYEMLTGRPVFREENPLDTLLCVLEREPQLPRKFNPRIPEDLEQICLRCLEKKPERRYESAAAVADDLERYLKKEPIQAPAVSLWQRLQRWVRREPALVSRLIGLGAIAGIVQINFMASDTGEPNHWAVMCVLGAWALLSFVLERVQRIDRIAGTIPYLWALLDCILFTTSLHLAHGPRELLLAGYPLLIAASGLWFRVRMVWFMMGLCLAAFGVLVLLNPWSTPVPRHYPGLFAAMLLIVGMIVAYQVRRIRVLSRYFEQRGAPRSMGHVYRSS
jgi:serine/threonine-protein kinase